MKNKNLLYYVTTFLSGMTVMAVELTCSRLLAPYFSSSSIVWTVIIGLIMISLSIGNVLGGRSADKYKSLDRLYFYLWIASLWIAIIPFVGKYIIAGVTGILMLTMPGSALLVMGSAICCMIIFTIPMILFGMVTPYMVKLAVSDMENNGRVTGQIYAMSTIGSIVGTFIPTFATIPLIGTSKTFFLFALLLNLLCLYRFVSKRVRSVKNIVATILILVFLFIPFQNSFAFWKSDIIYEGESVYNYLQVTETEDSVILSTNVAFGVQSIYKKDGTLSGYYYEYANMAPFFMKDASFDKEQDVLVLGLGTGTFSKQMKKYFPNTRTDSVEIDGKIAELAKTYFALEDSETNIFITDGRSFLDTPDAKQYDIILADAYQDITVPFHMSTIEFFEKVKAHLKPGGILIININMRAGDFNGVPEYLSQTVKSQFAKVYRFDLSSVTNSLLICSDDQNMMSQYEQNVAKYIGSDHELSDIAQYLINHQQEIFESDDKSLILTDDLAPVEMLSQRALSKIIDSETEYFRTMLKNNQNGIKGLLDMLSN